MFPTPRAWKDLKDDGKLVDIAAQYAHSNYEGKEGQPLKGISQVSGFSTTKAKRRLSTAVLKVVVNEHTMGLSMAGYLKNSGVLYASTTE